MKFLAPVVCLTVLVLTAASPAPASDRHPTVPEIEGEVMCVSCNEPLDMSTGPLADRERALIRTWIAQGYRKSEIEQKLVDEFGRSVLLSPPTSGFNAIAWVLPIAGGLAAALLLAWGAWRWSRGRQSSPPDDPSGPIEPELDRQLDEELARLDA